MAKRSDTRETVLLALELMRRIPRNRTITAKELHEQLVDTEVARDLRTIQRQLDMLSEYFEIDRDDSERTYRYCWKEPDVFEQVSNALYSNLWLNLDYENSSGKRTQAEVMPLGLAQQGTSFYLVCRFKGYDNERSLALHRIISAQVSAFTFERPKDFDLERYDNDGRFGFGEGRRIKLTFCIDKNAGYHLLESPLSEDQQVSELEDCYEIVATVVDSAMLEWWLRGFGDAVSDVRRGALRGSRKAF